MAEDTEATLQPQVSRNILYKDPKEDWTPEHRYEVEQQEIHDRHQKEWHDEGRDLARLIYTKEGRRTVDEATAKLTEVVRATIHETVKNANEDDVQARVKELLKNKQMTMAEEVTFKNNFIKEKHGVTDDPEAVKESRDALSGLNRLRAKITKARSYQLIEDQPDKRRVLGEATKSESVDSFTRGWNEVKESSQNQPQLETPVSA